MNPNLAPKPATLSAGGAIGRATRIGIAVNSVLAVFKLGAGIAGGSQAVVADGIEALLDVFTAALVYAGARLWSRPADECHPHGHGRIETFFAVGIGLSLVFAAVGIGWRALVTLQEPHGEPPGWIAAVAAFVSIVGKEVLYRWTLGIGREIRSLALVAAAWHYRSDALSSVPVLLAVTGAIVFPAWTLLDHLGAVVVSAFILHAAFRITWPRLKELIDAGAPPEVRKKISDLAAAHPGVLQVHGVRTRSIGSALQVDLHLVVEGSLSIREGHAIAQEVEERLVRDIEEVIDVTAHLEPPEEAQPDGVASAAGARPEGGGP